MNASNLVATRLNQITVSSPARLHLGFLDLNGNIGRKFGSFGLAIDSHYTTVNIQAADSLQIKSSNEAARQKVIKITDQFYNTIGSPVKDKHVTININELIPSHAGFGSGTQLNLTVGSALAIFHGITISTQDLAETLGRGQRSGIGIASFDHGGFIVDGGNKAQSNKPPMLFQHSFPEQWRIVLIMDPSNKGIHGQQETSAFNTLPKFPESYAERICHLTLMQLLPSLIEQDINEFGEAVTNIQAIIGDHFAPAQGGRYTSKTVELLLHEALSLGFKGIAQSSWGPTGCVFASSEYEAQELVQKLNAKLQNIDLNKHKVEIYVAKANNSGAIIKPEHL